MSVGSSAAGATTSISVAREQSARTNASSASLGERHIEQQNRQTNQAMRQVIAHRRFGRGNHYACPVGEAAFGQILIHMLRRRVARSGATMPRRSGSTLAKRSSMTMLAMARANPGPCATLAYRPSAPSATSECTARAAIA